MEGVPQPNPHARHATPEGAPPAAKPHKRPYKKKPPKKKPGSAGSSAELTAMTAMKEQFAHLTTAEATQPTHVHLVTPPTVDIAAVHASPSPSRPGPSTFPEPLALAERPISASRTFETDWAAIMEDTLNLPPALSSPVLTPRATSSNSPPMEPPQYDGSPIPAMATTPPAAIAATPPSALFPDLSGRGRPPIDGVRAIPIGEPLLKERPGFYQKDDGVELIIQDERYRVSEALLKKSRVVAELLDDRPYPHSAIRLPQVTCNEMDLLLNLLDARLIEEEPLLFEQTELLSILRTSTILEFKAARRWALGQLDSIVPDIFDRLEVALQYDIEEWMEDACLAIVSRTDPWTGQDIRRLIKVLGPDKFATLLDLREQTRKCRKCAGELQVGDPTTPGFSGQPSQEINQAVKRLWA